MRSIQGFIKITIWVVLTLYCQPAHVQNTQIKPDMDRLFEENFKDRYSGRKFDYEGQKIVSETPPGTGEYAEYKNEEPRLEEKNNNEGILINMGPLSWLFYIILILAVLYLAFTLLNQGGTGLFSFRKDNKLQSFDRISVENIERTDVNSLIKKAENEHDYRLAIRYYYLLVLKTLSLKNFITIEEDKTNTDYLNEIHAKPFRTGFAYTSYLYNYIWYGEFPLNSDQYIRAKHNFLRLLNEVKK